MPTKMVIHATCGKEALRDEFDFIDEEHRSGHCRKSAHHPSVSWPKSTRGQGSRNEET